MFSAATAAQFARDVTDSCINLEQTRTTSTKRLLPGRPLPSTRALLASMSPRVRAHVCHSTRPECTEKGVLVSRLAIQLARTYFYCSTINLHSVVHSRNSRWRKRPIAIMGTIHEIAWKYYLGGSYTSLSTWFFFFNVYISDLKTPHLGVAYWLQVLNRVGHYHIFAGYT